MVLEATVVCVDNSEHMRNGDLLPSRLLAQQDAVNLLAGAKTQSNPENVVGVLSLAGKTPRVLVTPTPDLGKVLGAMHDLQVDGAVNFSSGVQVAQLALKHRQNKNQRQRIVIFVGSPVTADEASLVKIGKKLKKNNVAVDVVSFGGDDEANAAKLEAFVAAANSNDNSHLVTVPAGAASLADLLISSPVFNSDGEGASGFAAAAAAGAAVAAGAAGGGGHDFGVDPNLDPELALALRVSMEEERARQEAASAAAAAAGPGVAGVAAGGSVAGGVEGGAEAMDEDDLLQQALLMSMGAGGGGAGSAGGAGGDAAFLESVLATLPGVDATDPAVRAAAEKAAAENAAKDSDKK